MTSVLLAATGHLFNPYKDNGREGPPFVFSCGTFNCIAPRVEKIMSQHRLLATPRAVDISSNAHTYHLTLEACFIVPDDDATKAQSPFPLALAKLFKLTQVRKLKIVYLPQNYTPDDGYRARASQLFEHVIGPHLVRCRVSLEELEIDFAHVGFDILSLTIRELGNLRVLRLPTLTPELCKAIAAGPGARLRDLSANCSQCTAADLDALVAGCPDLLSVTINGAARFALLPVVSNLQYLQTLVVVQSDLFGTHTSPPLSLPTMQQCFGNMPSLHELHVYGEISEFNDSAATALATTVGSQLVSLTLSGMVLSSTALATVCCAASFPHLESLEIECGIPKIVDDISLSSRMKDLKIRKMSLARYTLTQLLANKPNLTDLSLDISAARSANALSARNSDQAATNQDVDWLGQLVRCPLRKLVLGGDIDGMLMPERVGQLAGTLIEVKLNMNSWSSQLGDQFVAELCTRCVLIESLTLISRSEVDSTVAFAGLHNNARLRKLAVLASVSSVDVLVDALVAMRSTDLMQAEIGAQTCFSAAHCAQLLQRFTHLEFIGFVSQDDVPGLKQRFPRVEFRAA